MIAFFSSLWGTMCVVICHGMLKKIVLDFDQKCICQILKTFYRIVMYALKHVRILHIVNFLHLFSQYFCVGTYIVNVSQTFPITFFFWCFVNEIINYMFLEWKGNCWLLGIVKKSFIDIIFKPSKGECLLLMFVILGGCWQAYCNLLYLY